ncbi:hypothetical protein HYY72_00510 [Candidatus Woesearchaeota archaeon]|nr:hypothetical protein [Candidatus Woesearchaeota archaeon]
MKKIIFAMMVTLLLNLGLVSAITQQEINEARSLIDSKADCKGLSDSQLEIIGEYYMEQMHPGEAHELMHKMMGIKEGSEAEKQFHINMAKTIHCNEDTGGMMGGGMMSMMMGSNMGYGMMGNYGYGFGYWNFLNVLYVILLVGLIILVYLWIIKLWKNMNIKSGKR